MIFKGTATALITPFTSDGVDFESLDRILDDQLAGGVDAAGSDYLRWQERAFGLD